MPFAVTYRCLDRRGLGWIEEAGWVRDSSGIPAPRRLGLWQVSYVWRGSGWHHAGGQRQRIVPGTCYALFPDLVHTYAPDPGTTWDELFFMFSGPLAMLLEQHGVLDRQRPLRRLESAPYWRQRLEAVLTKAAEQPPAASMLHLAAVLTEMADDGGGSWLAQAKRALEPNDSGHAANPATVGRRLGSGSEAFRKRFTRLAGLPPRRWQEQRRLERACELLLDPERTLSDVADRCGFADAFHLSRRFSAVVGLSPREWRRRLPR